MHIIGAIVIAFGILIIAMPELIAYMIGGFIICIGINILFFSYRIQKMQNSQEKTSSFSFGGYEFIKKR